MAPYTGDTAVLAKQDLARHQRTVKRVAAGILLFFSATGAVIWGAGGWESLAKNTVNWWGLGLGLALQVLCTGIQMIFASEGWKSNFYRVSILTSTITTMLGYYPVLLLLVALWLNVANLPWWAQILLVFPAALLFFQADKIPEKVFLK